MSPVISIRFSDYPEKKQTEGVEDSRRRMETDIFRLPRTQQFPPLKILRGSSRERMPTEVGGEHGMDRKVSGGIVEVTNSSSSSQQ